MLRRVHEERGAVVAIVTLTLLAMMGMLMLVVDVGGLFYRRGQLQNSADAAALAAALSCGTGEGPSVAGVQATYYTGVNSTGAIVEPGYPLYGFAGCNASAGTVTVQVQADQALFFAPALGADETASVRAEATASWGGAGIGEHVAPLMLSAHRLTDCQIPPPAGTSFEDGIRCAFWWNNSPTADFADLTNAEWGTLDLLKWNVTADTNCDNSTPPQFESWMFEGFSSPLPINPGDHPTTVHTDPHTYVCRGQGNFGAALDNIVKDAIDDPFDTEEPIYLYFPVNDPYGQIDSDGVPCVPVDLLGGDPALYEPCSVDKYDIIAFARLKIIALYKGNTDGAEAECADLWIRDANARCMVALWEGYTNEGLNAGGGENFGVVPVSLIG